MENCIFCKIVKGEAHVDKIYEDKDVIAFLDLNSLTKGHTLVVPKTHKRWLWEHNDKEYCEIMKVVKKIANVMRSHYNIEWVEMVVAGMGVHHTHVHILPRFQNDGHREIPLESTREKTFSLEELSEMTKDLKKAIDKEC